MKRNQCLTPKTPQIAFAVPLLGDCDLLGEPVHEVTTDVQDEVSHVDKTVDTTAHEVSKTIDSTLGTVTQTSDINKAVHSVADTVKHTTVTGERVVQKVPKILDNVD